MWRVFVALTRFCDSYRWTSTAIGSIWVAGARLSHVVAFSPYLHPHGPCGPLRIASFWWVYYVNSISPVGVFICVHTYAVHAYLAVDVHRTLYIGCSFCDWRLIRLRNTRQKTRRSREPPLDTYLESRSRRTAHRARR
jgi:hypothetical protein